MGQLSFFDLSDRLSALSRCNDPLEKLSDCIDWELFRPQLKKAFKKVPKSNAGRKPFDYVMMFKVLVLQSLYGISDPQIEFQIKDRLSFMRFLSLSLEDTVPDEKTIWLFREQLTNKGVIKKLFSRFDTYLNSQGFKAQKGSIVDASIVAVPTQRNTKSENDQIKSGSTPDEWKSQPAKLSQKDVDARWLKKNGKDHFGYKNHVNVDVKHKLIRQNETTPASVHESQVFKKLLNKKNSKSSVWADSAYSSEEISDLLHKKGIQIKIHKKGYRDHPLSHFQIKLNHKKSTIRARVEHVFAFMETNMRAKFIRCIGQIRATAKIGLNNLVYNLCRYQQLVKMA